VRSSVLFLFAVVLTGIWSGTSLSPVQADPDAEKYDAASWVGTWEGTVSTLDSHSSKPTESPITIVITAADIGKSWNIRGNNLTKDQSLAGVQSTTTLKRTGATTCSLVSDGVGSGRGGFTRHVTGELTRK
jgi:heme/copper-type cytochrome/quinol oxidase subunit 2